MGALFWGFLYVFGFMGVGCLMTMVTVVLAMVFRSFNTRGGHVGHTMTRQQAIEEGIDRSEEVAGMAGYAAFYNLAILTAMVFTKQEVVECFTPSFAGALLVSSVVIALLIAGIDYTVKKHGRSRSRGSGFG